MKKLFFAALLTVSLAASAFAADTKKVSSLVAGNFKVDFRNASDVTWTATDDFAKATFTLNQQKMEAFYDANGEIIGTSKSINLEELPVNAKRNFAKRFEGYTVKEAIRFEGTDDAAYYISAENEKESVILKVGDNNQISTYQKIKK